MANKGAISKWSIVKRGELQASVSELTITYQIPVFVDDKRYHVISAYTPAEAKARAKRMVEKIDHAIKILGKET